MSGFQITANLGISNQKFHVGLSLIELNEEDVVIIYSPALELSGYGHSGEEAKKRISGEHEH